MPSWIKESFSFQDLQRITARLIERVDVFAGLTQQELLHLLEASEKCTFDAGEAIVREGGTGSFLYVILDGRVTVLKSDASQRGRELAQLQAGDTFGEMSLVDQGVRSASVIALAPCVMLRLSEQSCSRQPASSAKIYRNLARILSRRLRDMDELFVLGKRS